MEAVLYGTFLFMVIVGVLACAALQAIGFVMFSGLQAPQRPSYKTLLRVWVIADIGAVAVGYLLALALPSPMSVLSIGVGAGVALLLVAVVAYLLIGLLAPLVATVAVTKVSWRQAALSLSLIYGFLGLMVLFVLYGIVAR